MGSRIRTVGGQAYFVNDVFFDLEVVLGQGADRNFFRQDDDAAVVVANTQFIFGAYHSFRQLSPNFSFFDGPWFAILRVKSRADGSDDNLLPGSYVGRAANNLQFAFAIANLYFGEGKFIGIRMFPAFFHIANHETFQASFDAFYFFHPFHLQPYVRQNLGDFFWCQVDVEIIFEPIK